MKGITPLKEKLESLRIDMHFRRGEVAAFGQAWRNLHANWVTAVKDCDRKEVEYSRLSREVDRELEKE